jgi:acyl-CoA synthetase (AMP-forming)/AMP-acid ligase II
MTAHVLRDGWVMTSDLSYEDEGGDLVIVDRNKDMIVSGSSNVYAAEIERALESHPAIAEAAVFGIPDEQWERRFTPLSCCRPGRPSKRRYR